MADSRSPARRSLLAVIAEELVRFGTVQLLGAISGVSIVGFVLTYLALLAVAPTWVRFALALSVTGIFAVLVVAALITVGYSLRPALIVDTIDFGPGMPLQLRASVVASGRCAVVAFHVESGAQRIPPALPRINPRTGNMGLEGLGIGSVARQGLTWIDLPIRFDGPGVESGWLGFLSQTPPELPAVLVATLDDRRTLRVLLPKD